MAVRRPLRWSLVAGALIAALVTPVGPAAAAPGPGGLAMVVQATDPLAPSVVLTNDTGAPCQIVTTAFGTVGVTSVGQSGAQVTPTVAPPSVSDAIGLLLADELVTLAPGASRTIPLLVAPAGPTGHVVASVTAAGNRAVGVVYPVRRSGALAITATYSVPDVDTTGAPKCPPASAGSVDTVATVPDQCGMVVPYGPDGIGFGNTCTSHGTGDYGGLLLAATGAYSLVFAPANGATGQARVRITLSTDVHGTIPTDGSPITVSVDLPGQVGLFTFPGTVGDRVVVEATEATIPDQCAVPLLQAPDGGGVGAGCLSHGQGYVDGALLTTSGQFTVRIDPADSGTGQVTLRQVVSHDIHDTIAPGGAPVTATIAAPGQIAQYTFVGTKGQRVKLVATGGTLPPQCGLPALLAPDGTEVGAACTGPGDTGASDPIVLPAGGTYTVVVNPDGLSTGTLTFALRAG